MRFAWIALLLWTSKVAVAQSPANKASLMERYYIYGNREFVEKTIHPVTGDTLWQFMTTGRYLKKSKEGVVLIDGHKWGGMGTRCGCEPREDGYWIERYENGNLKLQGRYDCGHKIGTWTYYHENGQMAKVESLKQPYPEMLTNEVGWDTLKRYYLPEGSYLEYYANGQLKVDGMYEIVEAFSATDTLFSFDTITYELKEEIIAGEFWIPRSRKTRVWTYYDENGHITAMESYERSPWRDEKIRPLESRYWEVIGNILKEEKKK